MDHDRRHFLSKLLDIPPILFGIVSLEEILKMVEQQRAQGGASVSFPSVWTPRKATIDIQEYTSQLEIYWKTHHRHTAFKALADSLLRIEALYRELSHARMGEWPRLQELLCGYHQFVAHVLRDSQRYDDAIDHLDKAFLFAESLDRDELKALVLHRRGRTLENADRIGEALRDYEKARKYEQRLPADLSGAMLLHAGLVDAKVAKTEKAKKAAISLLDRVGTLVRNSQRSQDPYFLDLSLDRYHQTRSAALIAVSWNEDAIAELKLVKCGPKYPRAQAYNDILQAQAHIKLGDYPDAAILAASGLAIVQEIDSKVNIARVMRINEQLQKSSFRNNPEAARLDYLLFRK
jgi:hypothetical protein